MHSITIEVGSQGLSMLSGSGIISGGKLARKDSSIIEKEKQQVEEVREYSCNQNQQMPLSLLGEDPDHTGHENTGN